MQSTHKDGNSLYLVFANNTHLLPSYECIIPTLSSVSDHSIVECNTILGASPGHFDSEQPIKSLKTFYFENIGMVLKHPVKGTPLTPMLNPAQFSTVL